jgi:hypothetical protein
MIVEREAASLAFADVMRIIFVISIAAALFIAFARPPQVAPQGGH